MDHGKWIDNGGGGGGVSLKNKKSLRGNQV